MIKTSELQFPRKDLAFEKQLICIFVSQVAVKETAEMLLFKKEREKTFKGKFVFGIIFLKRKVKKLKSYAWLFLPKIFDQLTKVGKFDVY